MGKISNRNRVQSRRARNSTVDRCSTAGGELGSRYRNADLRKGREAAKNKNMAIAEWPTADGRTDYILFVGLQAVGAVEAKRQSIDKAQAQLAQKQFNYGFDLRHYQI